MRSWRSSPPRRARCRMAIRAATSCSARWSPRRPSRATSELLDDAVAKGAQVAAGGEFNGTVVSATVLDRVTPAMRIYAEESFGPVKPVIRVKGVDEAIRIANDTEYGLSAAVFGRDIARALGVAKRIQSGICHINAPTVHDEAQMPFGGTKASGYGRFGGKAAIDEFTELRWITIQTGPHLSVLTPPGGPRHPAVG